MEKITFLGDLKIIMMTIRQVLVHDNVAVDTTSEGNLAEIRSKQ